MLTGTNYWDTGYMNLYLNNKPTRVYVPPDDPQRVYELSQTMIANDGSIPIGIDHLPEAIVKGNPILNKLDLLHVGDITAVEYNHDTNSVCIVEATFTNPLIEDLYNKGELEAVSIVSEVSTTPCTRNNEIPVINTEKVKRVDIVGVGACETCRIPLQTDKTMVYAKKPIMEDTTMSITKEELEEMFKQSNEETKKQFNELKEENKELNERLKALENPSEPADPTPASTDDNTTTEIAAMQAKIQELEKAAKENEHKAVLSAANARVDLAIQQGKVLPAQKKSMVELAASKPEAFDAMIKDAPVLVDVEKRQSLVAGFSLEDDAGEPVATEEEKNLENVLNHFKKE